jgi:hypothetical protein
MRLKNSIIADPVNPNENVLNIQHGSPAGYIAQYAKTTPGDNTIQENWVNNAAHITRNLIPICLATPEGLKLFNDASLTKRLQKTYVEIHESGMESITGLRVGLTVETEEHSIGWSGEKQKETIKTTRVVSEPTYKFRERQHKPISRFIGDVLVRYLDMDPDTQRPLIATVSDKIKAGYVYSADHKAGIMLFIEPDIAMKTVIEAFICYNFYPIGDVAHSESKLDLEGSGEMVEYEIEYSAITASNAGVRAIGQNFLDNLNKGILSRTPDMLLNVDEKEASVATLEGETGYNNNNGFNN